MSTRCQVKIIAESETPHAQTDPQYLYHHCDGYPSNIIPLLKKAAAIALKASATVRYAFNKEKAAEFNVGALPWEAGRTGKVAGAICAADPLQFEPDTPELHADIAYLYRLYLVGPGHSGAHVRWEVEVLQPVPGFWDNPTEGNMTIVAKRRRLDKVTPKMIKTLA